jgi:hypothetical protein
MRKSPEYRPGYGDCKAALLREIQAALRDIHEAKDSNRYGDCPSDSVLVELHLRENELRRLRAIVKTLKIRE